MPDVQSSGATVGVMSEYGRMWQQVEEIRRMLSELMPGVDVSSLAHSIRSASRINEKVAILFAEWSELEKKMAECDSESGARR
jgi:hypothetical protein